MIPLSRPSIGNEECEAVERILRSGQLVHGVECDLFEKELADYLSCKDVVVVSSGTAALHLALVSLGIGPGDAVLVPDFTYPATVNVVELVGARPILVDVDQGTYNITPANIRAAMEEWQGQEKVRAIMPVHEFGCPVDMTAIMQIARENNLLVIEDAACALGSMHNGVKVGTFGHAGCFSFHPRKAITTGEGGAIAVNDSSLADKLRMWRNHGVQRDEKGMCFVLPGFNYRMTNFQAALGRVQLRKFDNWLLERKTLQHIYREGLQNSLFLLPINVVGHAWQTFMVILPEYCNRHAMILKLKECGIETNLGAHAMHTQVYYQQKYAAMCEKLAGNNAEVLYRKGLALPLYQGLKPEKVHEVINELLNIINNI